MPLLRRRLALVIEATWLAGLILVPLVFRGREWVAIYSQPKYFLVHLSALVIIVAWTAEWALGHSENWSMGRMFDGAERWVGREPGRWAILAFGGFALTAVAATFLSPLPFVSIWGRDFEDLGYELYSTLSFLVILFAVSFRMRSKEQVIRFALAIAATATLTALYGISQHFGWDPIGRGANATRVISSLGNPLFFGSYLVMTVTITVALGVYGHMENRRWSLPLAALAVGAQIAALWFSGGRGPWLGTTISLIAYVVMGWIWLDRRMLVHSVLIIGVGIVIAYILIALPADAGHGSRGFGDLFEAPGEFVDAVGFVLDTVDTPAIAVPETIVAGPEVPTPSATTVLDIDNRGSALSGRGLIWRNSAELAVTRERPFDESGLVRGMRILFGFGPDMYFYSYPTVGEPQATLTGVSHAHNYLLQILMEEGAIGVVMMLTAAVLLIFAAWRVLRAGNIEPWFALFLIAVLAALAGRSGDQMGSVGRMTDLLLFFALAGCLIAITEISKSSKPVKPGNPRSDRRRRGRAPLRSQIRIPALLIAGVVTVVAVTIFVTKDLAMLRGGWIAANGFEQKAAGDADAAFRSFEKAAKLAPDVERYAIEKAGLIRRTAAKRDNPEDVDRLNRLAYDILARYEERDPLAWTTQQRLAQISLNLVALGDSNRIPEVVSRYDIVAALMEPYPFIQAEAAAALVQLGDTRRALMYSDRAIAVEAITVEMPAAWWARGSALLALGRTDEAMDAFDEAIARNPVGHYARLSYLDRASILEAAGDDAGAAEERVKAAQF